MNVFMSMVGPLGACSHASLVHKYLGRILFCLRELVCRTSTVPQGCYGLTILHPATKSLVRNCIGVSSPSTPTTTTPSGPSPTQSGITSDCNKYQIAKSGDYCSKFASDNGITTDELYAWNIVIGADGANCSKLASTTASALSLRARRSPASRPTVISTRSPNAATTVLSLHLIMALQLISCTPGTLCSELMAKTVTLSSRLASIIVLESACR